MAQLKDKVQDALDESRILILGVQVLIGFDYRAPFEKGFDALPHAAQLVKLTSLGLLLVTLALLITPGADHRICERGEDTPEFHRLASGFASAALLPFATALGIDLAVAAYKLGGLAAAIGSGVGMAGLALAFWYGIELIFRPDKRRRRAMQPRKDDSRADVKDKIKHALTEARVVLPGAQALLGFQFATFLTESFDKLPASLKALHLASLSCMAVAVVLLITPAAWHRMVERGEENERMHKVASAMVVAALVPLALGLSGDFYVVAYKVLRSHAIAGGLAMAALIMFLGLWFGLTLSRRAAGYGSPTMS